MKIIPDVIQAQTIQSLPSTAKAQDAALLMVERNISAVLIIDDGKLSGIITERDMCRVFAAENQNAETALLKDIMTTSLETIEPGDDARDALELMELRGFRHLPVVDDGRVVGIVSVRDLYSVVKRQLARAAELSEKYLFNDRYHVD